MKTSTPPIFAAAARKRSLAILAALFMLLALAMQPAMQTMIDHGHSVIAFELAGSVSRSREIVSEWGSAGETAAWWQLAIDLPFLVVYGLFLAGACTAVARRAHATGRVRLERVASVCAWFGPAAAAADLLQNVSLAFELAGHVTQPWPAIAAVAFPIISGLAIVAVVVAAAGALMTRSTAAPARP